MINISPIYPIDTTKDDATKQRQNIINKTKETKCDNNFWETLSPKLTEEVKEWLLKE